MFQSLNPATGEIFGTYSELTAEQLQEKIDLADDAFGIWRNLSFEDRAKYLRKVCDLLRKNAENYAEIMAKEMGKPLKAGIAEIEKCAWACEFYADNAAKFLADEPVNADVQQSYISFEPLGIVLAVMPWNFPFWQVFRAAAPALMVGNTMLLKHASNVPKCGITIEEIFIQAGFPKGVFQNLLIRSDKVSGIIKDERVKAATLTGSEHAGSEVAAQCGKEIKKTVLELGGSDPFIVLKDADLDIAAKTATTARFQNNGQSCIAAKRFMVAAEVYEQFLEKFKLFLSEMVVGDPVDEKTDIGPLATKSIFEGIQVQVEKSVKMGARIIYGGKRKFDKGYFYEPTILADIKQDMPVSCEETFGPVAAVIKVKDENEAVAIANNSRFGLGSSVWTKDIEVAKKVAAKIEAGSVFINGMVKSDPRLPFGGIKKSGYGRELSHYGIKEFVNVKTVVIN